MKKDIHPQYHSDAKIICACGAIYITGSTKKEIQVELCSNCHPFYTGKQKLVDTAGRVEKFEKRIKQAIDLKKQKEVEKEVAREKAEFKLVPVTPVKEVKSVAKGKKLAGKKPVAKKTVTEKSTVKTTKTKKSLAKKTSVKKTVVKKTPIKKPSKTSKTKKSNKK